MAIIEHRFIHSREDFFRLLEECLSRVREFEGKEPYYPLWTSFRRQLEAIKQWTEAGRTPTVEERQSIMMGRIITRELEPAPTTEIQHLTDRLTELEFYFKHWKDDDAWNSMDDTDMSTFFPFDES